MAHVSAIADLLVWLSQASPPGTEPTSVETVSGSGGWYWVERASWVVVILSLPLLGVLYRLLWRPRIMAGLWVVREERAGFADLDVAPESQNILLKLGCRSNRLLLGAMFTVKFPKQISKTDFDDQKPSRGELDVTFGRVQWQRTIDRLYPNFSDVEEITLSKVPPGLSGVALELSVVAENLRYEWRGVAVMMLPSEAEAVRAVIASHRVRTPLRRRLAHQHPLIRLRHLLIRGLAHLLRGRIRA